ncbi:D-2-hydroxyacid dehydrogenase [Humidisolicoccus flavus]|uniref:D-2-hydroxyacid dehydrogenase n=1 Tax=Humidisolicoccus flavus TaxID=3111414 RepID=UPI0032447944
MTEHHDPRTLRVALAAPLPEELCKRIEALEPRVTLLRDHALLAPMRHAADWPGDPAFQRSPEQQAALDSMIDSAEVLFSFPDVQTESLQRAVRSNPNLRWVQLMAAGGGAQVRSAAFSDEELERVQFTTSAGVHGSPLAEFAVFGVFAGAKNLARLRRDQADHHWPSRWEMQQVSDMTVLVVGLGGIGKATAQKFKALGAHVLGTTRRGEPVEHVDELVSIDDLGGAVARADAIIVTLPGTDETAGLIGREVFANVKPGVILVNVGRGTVIDEDAMIDALRDHSIGFAALDVFENEPLAAKSPLWDLPNVLVSPHTGALDANEERRIADLFADNARRYLDGLPLRNVVDTVEFY